MAENQKNVVGTPERPIANVPKRPIANTLDGILIKLLLLCGELNYIFRAKGFGLDKGIVFVLDEDASKTRFLKNLTDICGAVMVDTPKRSCENMVRNYQLAVCEYSRYEKWENLKVFMAIKKFVSIIVTYGIIPNCLKDLAYTIEISAETCGYMETPEFREEMDDMIEFVRENPDVVVRELDLLPTSESFKKENNDSPLFADLMAALSAYSAFYRSTHSDKETAMVKAEAEREILKRVQIAEKLAEECDSIDAIIKVVTRYFMAEDNFEFVHLGEVDEISLEKMKSGKAVVYDQEVYYMPEVLFKRACGSLLASVPYIQIKQTLRDEEILVCNRTENTNFTIKKVFVRRGSESGRERVLKFRREFFISREGLYPEERRSCTACGLGKRKK